MAGTVGMIHVLFPSFSPSLVCSSLSPSLV